MSNNIVGAILAGGKARRMDYQPKGLIAHRQKTNIINHIVTEMVEAGIEDIAISANDPDPYEQFDKPIIADINPAMGPLAGIEAVLQYAKDLDDKQAVIFMPSDMPAVNHDMMTKLIDAFNETDVKAVYAVNKTNGKANPICCVIAIDALDAISRSIEKDHLRVITLWEDIGCEAVEFDDASVFLNLNTHQDLSNWQGIQQ
jgi:molybdopterin-guanine dinucleotide biosynthesis protein A